MVAPAKVDPEELLRSKVRKAVIDEKIRQQARELVARERPAPELTLSRAEDIEREKVRSYFGGRLILGSFQLMVGPGEAGKGMVSCDIISRLSTGAPFPDEGKEWRPPMTVMVCVTEDSKGRVRGRLEAVGADLKRVYFVDGPPATRGGLIVPSPIAFDDDAGSLLKLCQSVDAKALFLETMVEHLGDRNKRRQWSTNNEAEVRMALAPIVAVCREGDLIGWGVMHPRKSQDGGIEDSISGSAAFRNVGRSVLHVYRDPAETEKDSPARILVTSKANYMATRPPSLRFRIDKWEVDESEGKVVWGIPGRTLIDPRSADEIWREMQENNKKRRDYTVRDAEKYLTKLLEGGATVKIEDVRAGAEAAEISWRAIEKAKLNLSIESIKEGFPAMVVGWKMPKLDDGGI